MIRKVNRILRQEDKSNEKVWMERKGTSQKEKHVHRRHNNNSGVFCRMGRLGRFNQKRRRGGEMAMAAKGGILEILTNIVTFIKRRTKLFMTWK